jgi:hypothetical protein
MSSFFIFTWYFALLTIPVTWFGAKLMYFVHQVARERIGRVIPLLWICAWMWVCWAYYQELHNWL